MVKETSASLMISTISMNSGSEWTLCLMVMRESPVATKLIFFDSDISVYLGCIVG